MILTYRHVRELTVYLTAIIGGYNTELMGENTDNSAQRANSLFIHSCIPANLEVGKD